MFRGPSVAGVAGGWCGKEKEARAVEAYLNDHGHAFLSQVLTVIAVEAEVVVVVNVMP